MTYLFYLLFLFVCTVLYAKRTPTRLKVGIVFRYDDIAANGLQVLVTDPGLSVFLSVM